jgi:hypothetical protein
MFTHDFEDRFSVWSQQPIGFDGFATKTIAKCYPGRSMIGAFDFAQLGKSPGFLAGCEGLA